MIELEAQILGAEAVAARFESADPRVKDATRDAVRSLAFALLTKVKSEKLMGQVLRVRTGHLRQSINEKFVEDGDRMESRVGTNVAYGRFWELGFTVPARTIKPKNAGALFWPGALHPVRSVTQQQRTMAPRPFLVPSLEEMRGEIRARLMRAMRVV
jgi:phage gpG-like protein